MSATFPATPCVRICVVDPVSALCIGCGRTIAEIAAWPTMSEADRVAVMGGLEARLREARSRARRGQRARHAAMMRLFAPLAILAAMAAVLVLTPAETRIFGLDHRELAAAATLLAMLVYLLSAARPSDVARVASSVAVWAALLVALTGVYAYRFEAADFFDRVTAELLPSEPQVGQGGEVIVNRRLSGEFAVAARVDGARVTFLFDTGASMVVLTAADARKAGIDTRGLAFDVPVATANGPLSRPRSGSIRSRSGRSSCATSPRSSPGPGRSKRACSA